MTQGIGLAMSGQWEKGVFEAIANNEDEAQYLFELHKARAVMNDSQRQRQ